MNTRLRDALGFLAFLAVLFVLFGSTGCGNSSPLAPEPCKTVERGFAFVGNRALQAAQDKLHDMTRANPLAGYSCTLKADIIGFDTPGYRVTCTRCLAR